MARRSTKSIRNWARGVAYRYVPMMITCQEFEDFVIAYLEGELPRRQTVVFELHLKVCRECRDYLTSYKRTIEVSKRAFQEPGQQIPDEVPEDLVRAILAARQA